ncbi:MAG TPA: hypothetical protein VEQ58_13090 [Polyangiaceae bacterium]|nr:hypothetical protein [Polyangiaceae bacterium]
MRKLLTVFIFAVAASFVRLGTAAAADFTVSSSGQGAYVINGQNNPALTLVRGRTYTFNVTTSGHPFWIKTVQETGVDNNFDTGVTNNGISPGLVTFAVPESAPARLFYQCQFHEPMTGQLDVVAAPAPASRVAALTPTSRVWLGVALGTLGALAGLSRVRRRAT